MIAQPRGEAVVSAPFLTRSGHKAAWRYDEQADCSRVERSSASKRAGAAGRDPKRRRPIAVAGTEKQQSAGSEWGCVGENPGPGSPALTGPDSPYSHSPSSSASSLSPGRPLSSLWVAPSYEAWSERHEEIPRDKMNHSVGESQDGQPRHSLQYNKLPTITFLFMNFFAVLSRPIQRIPVSRLLRPEEAA